MKRVFRILCSSENMEFDWRTGSHISWSFESCDWFNVTPRDFINHHYLFIRWICQNVVSWHNGSAVYVSQVIWFYDLIWLNMWWKRSLYIHLKSHAIWSHVHYIILDLNIFVILVNTVWEY